jgi:hypothetical protein
MSAEIAAIMALDRVTELATNLRAMLTITRGEFGESFRSKAPPVQDAFLNACAALVDEIIAEVAEYEVRNA